MGQWSQLGHAPPNADYTRNIYFLLGDMLHSRHSKSRIVFTELVFRRIFLSSHQVTEYHIMPKWFGKGFPRDLTRDNFLPL